MNNLISLKMYTTLLKPGALKILNSLKNTAGQLSIAATSVATAPALVAVSSRTPLHPHSHYVNMANNLSNAQLQQQQTLARIDSWSIDPYRICWIR